MKTAIAEWVALFSMFMFASCKGITWTVWRSKGTDDTDYIYRWSGNYNKATWYRSDQECRKNGWVLAKIVNAKEDNFLRTQLKNVNGASSWIGLKLTMGSTTTNYFGNWSDGTPFVHNVGSSSEYTNWIVGEPQPSTTIDTCVNLFSSTSKQYLWDDYGCGYNKSMICQSSAQNLSSQLQGIAGQNITATKSQVDNVIVVVDELLQSDNMTEDECRQNLEAMDEILDRYQGDDYRATMPLLDIFINSTKRGDALTFGSETAGLRLTMSPGFINEAFSRAGNNQSTLSIGSILYKTTSFFAINTSSYSAPRPSMENKTFITQPILSDPFMTFGERSIFRLPATNAVGRTISGAVSNVVMRNLTNHIEVTSRNVCQNANPEFLDYQDDTQLRCVFWNTTSNDWSNDGCVTELSPSEESNCYDVTCRCNHLTHFTVVFDASYIYTPTYLDYITITGSIVGGIFLLLTCVSILSLRHMRNDINKCIVFNISLNLLLFQTMFLVGIDRTKSSSRIHCEAISFLLHLFTLTSWFWMLVESVYLLLALCLREHATTRVKRTLVGCGVLAYVIPLGIASFTIGLQKSYLSPKYCWLRATTVLHTVVFPIMGVLTTNFFVGSYAMYTMICASKVSTSVHSMAKIKQNIRRIIYLSFLLGFPWILGIFMLLAQDPMTKKIFSILFTVFLTLQDVVIFSAFCATDDIFKASIKSLFGKCGRGFRTLSSESTSNYMQNTSSDNHQGETETDRIVNTTLRRKQFRESVALESNSAPSMTVKTELSVELDPEKTQNTTNVKEIPDEMMEVNSEKHSSTIIV